MLSAEEKKKLVAGWRRRQKQEKDLLQKKRDLAMKKAEQAAAMLKQKYHVQRVILFGSLVKGTFWEHSDIDMAVCGLDEPYYLDAFWDITQLTYPFNVDLISLEDVSQKLAKKIGREGMEI